MDDYDDEYYDDEDRPSRGYPRRERFADEDTAATTTVTTTRRCRADTAAATRTRGVPAPRVRSARTEVRPLRGSTRGALAMDPRRMAMLFDESSPLSKITTLRPKDYSEARTIGERSATAPR